MMVSTKERVTIDDAKEERTADRGRSTVRCNTSQHGWRETNGCAS